MGVGVGSGVDVGAGRAAGGGGGCTMGRLVAHCVVANDPSTQPCNPPLAITSYQVPLAFTATNCAVLLEFRVATMS